MKSLQSAAKDFETLGAKVYGISRDSVADQAKFAKQCKLKMPLLSDADGSATTKFDAAYEGRPFSQRVTFVIDPEGVIQLRDTNVKVATHGPDLVQAIKDLK